MNILRFYGSCGHIENKVISEDEMNGWKKPILVKSIFGNKYDVSNMNYIGVRNNKFSTSVGLIIYYYQKLKFRDKYSSTLSLEQQEKLINNKNKFNIDSSSILGKVYGYFFDN